MPKRCAAFGCRGNYAGEPYSRKVRFSTEDKEERNSCIEAMPNEPGSLNDRKEIYICASHFDCDWKTSKGGKRPTQAPSVFPNVPKSCRKQILPARRSDAATSDIRREKERKHLETLDKINDFEHFSEEVGRRFSDFTIFKNNEDLSLSKTDAFGRKVLQFIHFKKVTSPFGFLYLVSAEKDSMEISKGMFSLQKKQFTQ